MSVSSAQRWLRAATARGAHHVLARVEPPPPPPPTPAPRPPPTGVAWSAPLPQGLGVEHGRSTARLVARLSTETVAEVETAIGRDEHNRDPFAGADAAERGRLLLSLGIHYGIARVAQEAGLPTAQPPEDVHAMARGALAAAGGLYEADLVADALAGVGVALEQARAGLDFGCSSGRVLRVLTAAYPEVAWHGCDPNGPAIAWARAELPQARYFRSGDVPPLDLPDGSLDVAFAISIWSHFEPALGLRWLEEMHRLIRPGGHLVLTTHGFTTIDHDVRHERRPAEQAEDVRRALATTGAWYHAEFGEDGDWGVVNPDWGTAFLSAEWVLAHACPAWQVLDFAPGRNAGNQDVWVLRRV